MKEPSKIGSIILAGIFLVIIVIETGAEWLRDACYRLLGKKPPPALWRAPIQHRKG